MFFPRCDIATRNNCFSTLKVPSFVIQLVKKVLVVFLSFISYFALFPFFSCFWQQIGIEPGPSTAREFPPLPLDSFLFLFPCLSLSLSLALI